MTRNLRKITLLLTWALIIIPCIAQATQAVIFPQKLQPGIAKGMVKANHFILQNKVLKATFCQQDSNLIFWGCPALGLLPQTELFYLILGDSSIVKASDMKVENVRLTNLPSDKNAPTLSHQYSGKAVEAHFSYENLSVAWRAILRDGSHYLRTELDISTTHDQAMKGIIAMNYQVEKKQEYTIPTVIGNTRGSLLASNHIFAGLETPMGINGCKDTQKTHCSTIEGLWKRNTLLNPSFRAFCTIISINLVK